MKQLSNVVKTIVNHPILDGLYHPIYGDLDSRSSGAGGHVRGWQAEWRTLQRPWPCDHRHVTLARIIPRIDGHRVFYNGKPPGYL